MDELAGLTEEARKRAMERYRLLQPHLEHNEPLRAVGKAASLPYRTAHRLVSQYRCTDSWPWFARSAQTGASGGSPVATFGC